MGGCTTRGKFRRDGLWHPTRRRISITLGDRLHKRSLGPLFSFPLQGCVSPDAIRLDDTEIPPDYLRWVARSARHPGHFRTRHERKATVPSRTPSGYSLSPNRLQVNENINSRSIIARVRKERLMFLLDSLNLVP